MATTATVSPASTKATALAVGLAVEDLMTVQAATTLTAVAQPVSIELDDDTAFMVAATVKGAIGMSVLLESIPPDILAPDTFHLVAATTKKAVAPPLRLTVIEKDDSIMLQAATCQKAIANPITLQEDSGGPDEVTLQAATTKQAVALPVSMFERGAESDNIDMAVATTLTATALPVYPIETPVSGGVDPPGTGRVTATVGPTSSVAARYENVELAVDQLLASPHPIAQIDRLQVYMDEGCTGTLELLIGNKVVFSTAGTSTEPVERNYGPLLVAQNQGIRIRIISVAGAPTLSYTASVTKL